MVLMLSKLLSGMRGLADLSLVLLPMHRVSYTAHVVFAYGFPQFFFFVASGPLPGSFSIIITYYVVYMFNNLIKNKLIIYLFLFLIFLIKPKLN